MDDQDVPADFPQEFLSAVPGAQPKLLVYQSDDGRYVDSAPRLRAERWAICADLREQLVDYIHKHRPQSGSVQAYVEKVGAAIELKRAEWGVSPAEANWLRKELKAWTSDDQL